MQIVGFVLLWKIFCSAGASAPRRGRIVGGSEAEPGEFGFMASLSRRGKHFCGASLVHERFLLTAAHCLCGSNKVLSPASIKGTMGFHDLTQGNAAGAPIKAIFLHPDYKCSSVYNDIALLELSQPVKNIEFAHITTRKVDTENGTVMGWGWNSEDILQGQLATVLQRADVQILDNDVCQLWYSRNKKENVVTKTQLCAGHLQGGIDACWADSGGALVDQKHRVIGIISTGVGCARPGLPGIYTRVSEFVDWIDQVITNAT